MKLKKRKRQLDLNLQTFAIKNSFCVYIAGSDELPWMQE